MFQTDELPELILRAGDEEQKAEPQEGELSVATLTGPSSAELTHPCTDRQHRPRLSGSSPENPERTHSQFPLHSISLHSNSTYSFF